VAQSAGHFDTPELAGRRACGFIFCGEPRGRRDAQAPPAAAGRTAGLFAGNGRMESNVGGAQRTRFSSFFNEAPTRKIRVFAFQGRRAAQRSPPAARLTLTALYFFCFSRFFGK